LTVGLLVSKLEEGGILNKTMIVFTADHGEMMGSHGMHGKGVFYEEATRVPLILFNRAHFPPSAEGRVVKVPVSHLDVHATILDYLDASTYDVGDGSSLRRFIENTSYNQLYDESVVVSELDGQFPASDTKLSGRLGKRTAFMVRKGSYKLILPRLATS
jgi:arylsulfatase A-like enzyme